MNNKILDAYMRVRYCASYIAKVRELPMYSIHIGTYMYNKNTNHYEKLYVCNNDVYRVRVLYGIYISRVML